MGNMAGHLHWASGKLDGLSCWGQGKQSISHFSLSPVRAQRHTQQCARERERERREQTEVLVGGSGAATTTTQCEASWRPWLHTDWLSNQTSSRVHLNHRITRTRHTLGVGRAQQQLVLNLHGKGTVSRKMSRHGQN